MLPSDHEASMMTDSKNVDSDRREFLRTSIYAAYATPLLTALLVDAGSAAASGNNCTPEWCDKLPDTAKPRCCD